MIFWCATLMALTAFSQDDVVTNAVSYQQTGDRLEMTITLDIKSQWIVYDSIAGKDGPIPFSLSLAEDPAIKILGVKKPKRQKKYDDLFEMDIYYFKDQAQYVFSFQNVSGQVGKKVTGSFEFMSCNLTSGVCLPPEAHSFSFTLK